MHLTALMYRPVRGQLPSGMMANAEGGPLMATEPAFMSVSRSRKASVFYMQDADHGENVLWQLTTTGQTAEGFHMGADVALLSMFPEEEEVLFPPNTAMIVMRPELATKVDDDGKRYLVVDAKPSFI